jgi:parallel beta-helix repeat protein
MSKTKVCVVAAAAAFIGLSAQSLQAATIYRAVGSCTTSPVVPASRHYSTIQAAVDASVASGQAAIILVCPGTYREQVNIGPSPDYAPVITLKGVSPTGAVIAPPAGGLVANYQSTIPLFSGPTDANSNGWVSALLLVHDTSTVTVTNIAVDGTGATCASVAGVPSAVAGILFANIGDESYFTTAGSIKSVQVHDLPGFSVGGPCGYSSGIISENSFIKVTDNTITNAFYAGIWQFGGINDTLRNTVSYIGVSGIRATSALPNDLSLNKLSQITENAIVLEGGINGATVDSNTITPTISFGIYAVDTHNSNIVNNSVTGGFGSIFLDLQSSGNLVQNNSLSACGFACIMDRGSLGGNLIHWNDLFGSSTYGIWLNLPADDDIYGTLFQGSYPLGQICHSSNSGFSTGSCAEGN